MLSQEKLPQEIRDQLLLNEVDTRTRRIALLLYAFKHHIIGNYITLDFFDLAERKNGGAPVYEFSDPEGKQTSRIFIVGEDNLMMLEMVMKGNLDNHLAFLFEQQIHHSLEDDLTDFRMRLAPFQYSHITQHSTAIFSLGIKTGDGFSGMTQLFVPTAPFDDRWFDDEYTQKSAINALYHSARGGDAVNLSLLAEYGKKESLPPIVPQVLAAAVSDEAEGITGDFIRYKREAEIARNAQIRLE